jgi:hypothetical protein
MNAWLSTLAPRGQVFVLSHMRSYSSVLSHILGSHPEIDGYCETHLRYRSGLDLLRLRHRVARLTGEPLRGRWVLDKVLHNYRLADSVLRHPRTVAIFMVRRPAETVPSILEMGHRLRRVGWHSKLDEVVRYYELRARRLAELAAEMRGRGALVQSEMLLDRPTDTLAFLSHFLRLATPLSEEYRRFPHTGEPGFGDPSPLLATGSIASARAPQGRPLLPDLLGERLESAYAHCRSALVTHCVGI